MNFEDLDFLNDINPSVMPTTEDFNFQFFDAVHKPEQPAAASQDILQELAAKLSQHNEMVKEIQRLSMENAKLIKQSKSFGESAESVRLMYQNEKKLLQEIKSKNFALNEELDSCKCQLEAANKSLKHTEYMHEQTIGKLDEKHQKLEEINKMLINFCFSATQQLVDSEMLGANKRKEILKIKNRLVKNNYEIPELKNFNSKSRVSKKTKVLKDPFPDMDEELNYEKEFVCSIFDSPKKDLSYNIPTKVFVDNSTQCVSLTSTKGVNTDSKTNKTIGVNTEEHHTDQLSNKMTTKTSTICNTSNDENSTLPKLLNAINEQNKIMLQILSSRTELNRGILDELGKTKSFDFIKNSVDFDFQQSLLVEYIKNEFLANCKSKYTTDFGDNLPIIKPESFFEDSCIANLKNSTNNNCCIKSNQVSEKGLKHHAAEKIFPKAKLNCNEKNKKNNQIALPMPAKLEENSSQRLSESSSPETEISQKTIQNVEADKRTNFLNVLQNGSIKSLSIDNEKSKSLCRLMPTNSFKRSASDENSFKNDTSGKLASLNSNKTPPLQLKMERIEHNYEQDNRLGVSIQLKNENVGPAESENLTKPVETFCEPDSREKRKGNDIFSTKPKMQNGILNEPTETKKRQSNLILPQKEKKSLNNTAETAVVTNKNKNPSDKFLDYCSQSDILLPCEKTALDSDPFLIAETFKVDLKNTKEIEKIAPDLPQLSLSEACEKTPNKSKDAKPKSTEPYENCTKPIVSPFELLNNPKADENPNKSVYKNTAPCKNKTEDQCVVSIHEETKSTKISAERIPRIGSNTRLSISESSDDSDSSSTYDSSSDSEESSLSSSFYDSDGTKDGCSDKQLTKGLKFSKISDCNDKFCEIFGNSSDSSPVPSPTPQNSVHDFFRNKSEIQHNDLYLSSSSCDEFGDDNDSNMNNDEKQLQKIENSKTSTKKKSPNNHSTVKLDQNLKQNENSSNITTKSTKECNIQNKTNDVIKEDPPKVVITSCMPLEDIGNSVVKDLTKITPKRIAHKPIKQNENSSNITTTSTKESNTQNKTNDIIKENPPNAVKTSCMPLEDIGNSVVKELTKTSPKRIAHKPNINKTLESDKSKLLDLKKSCPKIKQQQISSTETLKLQIKTGPTKNSKPTLESKTALPAGFLPSNSTATEQINKMESMENAVDEILKLFPKFKPTRIRKNVALSNAKIAANSYKNIAIGIATINASPSDPTKGSLLNDIKKEKCKRKIFEEPQLQMKLRRRIGSVNDNSTQLQKKSATLANNKLSKNQPGKKNQNIDLNCSQEQKKESKYAEQNPNTKLNDNCGLSESSGKPTNDNKTKNSTLDKDFGSFDRIMRSPNISTSDMSAATTRGDVHLEKNHIKCEKISQPSESCIKNENLAEFYKRISTVSDPLRFNLNEKQTNLCDDLFLSSSSDESYSDDDIGNVGNTSCKLDGLKNKINMSKNIEDPKGKLETKHSYTVADSNLGCHKEVKAFSVSSQIETIKLEKCKRKIFDEPETPTPFQNKKIHFAAENVFLSQKESKNLAKQSDCHALTTTDDRPIPIPVTSSSTVCQLLSNNSVSLAINEPALPEYESTDRPESPAFAAVPDATANPVIIPLERATNRNANYRKQSNLSLIDKFLSNFDCKQQTKVYDKINPEKNKIQAEEIAKLERIIDHYVEGDATDTQVKKCIFRLFQNTKKSKLICKAIVETIEISRNRAVHKTTDSSCSMTETEYKVLGLTEVFSGHIRNFKEMLIAEIHNKIFTLKAEKIPLENLMNLLKFNILLMNLSTEQNPSAANDGRKMARLLLCKCLYYYNVKAIPMAFQLLVSYTSLLPRRNDPFYKDDDAIVMTIQSILNCTPYSMDKTDLKHRPIFYLLKDFYNYERVKPSREQLVAFLMQQIRQNMLRDVAYAFALICKQHGIEWTARFVIEKHILVLLYEYYGTMQQTDANDERIECLLESLSYILKPFPLDFESFDKYLQTFANFLHSCPRKRIQQASICCILRTARFGLVNAFTAIAKWKPNYEIDRMVDIDRFILEQNASRANPLLADHLKRRERPLKVDIYQGSIDSPNDALKDADAVLAIEIIEHLYPDVLENLPYNIFGFMQPKVVVISTPNSDFNVLFDMSLPNGMRHPDHKFEWSRAQFRDWCQNICHRFPKYVVSLFGVGKSPPDRTDIGEVSQFGVFIRKDMVNMPLPCPTDIEQLAEMSLTPNEVISDASKEYIVVHSVEYPFYEDTRSLEEKIYDEASHHINQLQYLDNYRTIVDGGEKCVIPLQEIHYYVKQFDCTMDRLKQILEDKQFVIDGKNNIVAELDEELGHGDDLDEFGYDPDDGIDNIQFNSLPENPQTDEDPDETNKNSYLENIDKISNVSECWD